MKQKLSLLTLTLITALVASSQVRQVTSTEKLNGEYFYILPQTALVFEAPVTSIAFKKSDNFKKELSDDQQKMCEKKYGLDLKIYKKFRDGDTLLVKYKLGDIKLSQVAKPDLTKIFAIKASRKFWISQNISFSYDKDGILSESEISNENKSFDLLTKGVSAVTSIIGGVLKDSKAADDKERDPDFIELNSLIDTYNSLKQGTIASLNFDVYKDMTSNLEKKIEEKFSDIFYEKKTEAKIMKLVYTPEKNDSGKIIKLFNFNKINGLFAFNTDLQTKSDIFYSKENTFIPADSSFYSIQFRAQSNQFANYFDNTSSNSKKRFAYNIPQITTILFRDSKSTILDFQTLKIPQFGIIAYFEGKLSKVTVTLNPETGELKKVVASKAALPGDNISAAATNINDIVKLAKGDDEVTKLDKEDKILKLKKDIKELKDAGY